MAINTYLQLESNYVVYAAISGGERPEGDHIYAVDQETYDKFCNRPPGTFGVYDPDKKDLQIIEYSYDPEEKAMQVRSQRNWLLIECDWTQLPDVPQSLREKWEPYRQALRDITKQPGFPQDVTFPEPPGSA